MKTFSDKEIREQFGKLSTLLKEVIYSADIAEVIVKTSEKYGITGKRISHVAGEIGYIVLGLTRPDELPSRLSERLGMKPDDAKALARDVFKNVLFPLGNEIKRVHGFEITEQALEGEPPKPAAPVPPLPKKPEPVVILPRSPQPSIPPQPSAPLPPRAPFQPSQLPQQAAPIPKPPMVAQQPFQVSQPLPSQPMGKPSAPPMQRPPQTPRAPLIQQKNVILPVESKPPTTQEPVAPVSRARPAIPPAPPPPGAPKNIIMPGMPQKTEQKPPVPPRETPAPKPFVPPVQQSAPQQKIFVSPRPPVRPQNGGDPYREAVKPSEKEIPQKRDQVEDPRGPQPPFVPRKPTVPYINPKIPPINLREGQQPPPQQQKSPLDPYREEIE